MKRSYASCVAQLVAARSEAVGGRMAYLEVIRSQLQATKAGMTANTRDAPASEETCGALMSGLDLNSTSIAYVGKKLSAPKMEPSRAKSQRVRLTYSMGDSIPGPIAASRLT